MQTQVGHRHLNFRAALANCLVALNQKELAERVIAREDRDLGSLSSLGVNNLPVFLASRAVHELTGGVYKGSLALPRCEQDIISPLSQAGYSTDELRLISQIYGEEKREGRILHSSQTRAVFPGLIYIDRYYNVFNKLQFTRTASTKHSFTIIPGGVWLAEIEMGKFIDEGFIVTPDKRDYKFLASMRIKRR